MPASGRRSRAAPVVPAEPQLPDELVAVEDADIGDATAWDGVEVGPSVTVAAHARGVDITGSRLRGVRLTGCEIEQLRLTDVVLVECELSGAMLAKAVFSRVRFERCRMSGAYAAEAQLTDVVLRDCKMDECDFRMARWERVEADECDLHDASFTAARLSSSRLLRCNLTHADCTGVRLSDVALHGSALDDLRGATALRNAVIGSDQLVPLSLAVLHGIGVKIDDDYLTPDG